MAKFRSIIYISMVALLPLLFVSRQAHGQFNFLDALKTEESTPKAAPSIQEEDIAQKKKALSEQIREAQDSLRNTVTLADKSQAEFLNKKLSLLENLDLIYIQLIEGFHLREELQKKAKGLDAQLESWQANGPSPEFQTTFTKFDDLSGEWLVQNNKAATFQSTLNNIQESLNNAKTRLGEIERERRLLKEKLETISEATENSETHRNFEIAKLSSDLYQEQVHLKQFELDNEKLSNALNLLERKLLEKQIRWLKQHIHFGLEDLEEKIKGIEEQKIILHKELKDTRVALANAEEEWEAVNELNLSLPFPSPGLIEETEAKRLQRQAYQTKVTHVSQELQSLEETKVLWKKRHLVFNSLVKMMDLEDWEKETGQKLEDLERTERLLNTRLADLRKYLSTLDARAIDIEKLDDKASKWVLAQKTTIQELMHIYQDNLANLYRSLQLNHKLMTEIQIQTAHFSLVEAGGLVWKKLSRAWDFELTSVDDKPITVGKLILVLILLVLGIKLSRRTSRLLERRLFPRFHLETGIASALQTLIFYLLVFFLTIIVLYMVNVPLTLFTVVGGALAIGLGFGSQNIVKNFISGLILLIERPIKVGDMIEIEKSYGIVEKIGARSTIIRSFSNIHFLVPNSEFLEKTVINWTLSDDIVRVTINVGIAYGSSTRDAAKLIRQGVIEHGKVLDNPEPIVLFSDFGDNALQFEVHFWIKMRALLDRRQIESDIRFKIDAMFREAGITIAFPQRDVHLNTSKPLEVHLSQSQDNTTY